MTAGHDIRQPPRSWSMAWLLLLGCSSIVVTFGDIALMREGTGFLTSGFNSVHIGSATEILAFFVASLTVDLALILASWAVIIPVLARLPLSSLQSFCVAGAFGTGVPLALSAARYNVYSIAGNMFNVALLDQLSSTTWSSMAVEVLDEAHLVWAVAVPVLGLVLAWSIASLGRLERSLGLSTGRFLAPAPGQLWRPLVPIVIVSVFILTASSPTLSRLRYGLGKKPSSAAMLSLVHWVTDVDRDGFGAFTEPPDPAPWDREIHPYALDLPGNGIDEDGLAGDLEEPRRFPEPASRAEPMDGPKPHVLVIYLESFRADLIHRELDGQPITPFFNRLANEGAASDHSYVHSPWTLTSRSEFFGGRLVNTPGQSTLIDDFKGWGYTVAYFSGQDESYGDSERIVGIERADAFYDARQDKNKRTSRSTAPVSLQVSWKTLLGRVTDYLGEVDANRPLFLYANIVDTHFPYHHGGIDDILGVPPLHRGEIRSHRAERVFRAYANTAANVDRAAEALVEAWRARIGDADHAILVLADHGEAFYEEGALGHGFSISPSESRVPLIVWGIGGEWPEPIAPTDIRELLRRNLGVERGGSPPRARFVPDPTRSILQFAPRVRRPSVIALRRFHDTWSYDFVKDRFERIDTDGSRTPLDPDEHPAMFRELVWSWEARALAEAGAGAH
jgi:hypothetical protein